MQHFKNPRTTPFVRKVYVGTGGWMWISYYALAIAVDKAEEEEKIYQKSCYIEFFFAFNCTQ